MSALHDETFAATLEFQHTRAMAHAHACDMHLVDAQAYVGRAILAVASGDRRNALCDANIHIQAAIEALKVAEAASA